MDRWHTDKVAGASRVLRTGRQRACLLLVEIPLCHRLQSPVAGVVISIKYVMHVSMRPPPAVLHGEATCQQKTLMRRRIAIVAYKTSGQNEKAAGSMCRLPNNAKTGMKPSPANKA